MLRKEELDFETMDEDHVNGWYDFRATHIWYGPHSPLYPTNSNECEYLHIFFLTER